MTMRDYEGSLTRSVIVVNCDNPPIEVTSTANTASVYHNILSSLSGFLWFGIRGIPTWADCWGVGFLTHYGDGCLFTSCFDVFSEALIQNGEAH